MYLGGPLPFAVGKAVKTVQHGLRQEQNRACRHCGDQQDPAPSPGEHVTGGH